MSRIDAYLYTRNNALQGNLGRVDHATGRLLWVRRMFTHHGGDVDAALAWSQRAVEDIDPEHREGWRLEEEAFRRHFATNR